MPGDGAAATDATRATTGLGSILATCMGRDRGNGTLSVIATAWLEND
jgi:hypothetical protein